MLRSILPGGILLLCVAGALAARGAERNAADPEGASDLPARVQALARPLTEAGVVTRMVVGIREGRRNRVFGYGPPLAGAGKGPDGGTLFEIGSITKVFTGILLAEMAARGQVRLEDPVRALLPAAVVVPRHGDREITLLDLATHTSGLPRMPSNFAPKDNANPFADYTPERLHAFLSGHTLARAPGEQYEYSNLGSGLLGYALGLRAGAGYESLLRDRLLRPLGMRDTGITLTPDQRSRFAPGHDVDGNPVAAWDIPTLAGAGALRSSVDDLLRFVEANLGGVEGPLGAALETARESRRRAGGDSPETGLGWHIRSGNIHWHNGETGGYHSFLGLDREKKLGVVVLSDTATRLVDDLAYRLLALLAGEAVEPLSIRTPVRVQPQLLREYVGRYELAPGILLTITLDDRGLMAQATGQDRHRLYAESDTAFFYRVVEARVVFSRNAGGGVEKLVMHHNGREVPGKKLD